MNSLLRSLARHRSLIESFVARDLRARYVGSTMGFFWSVIFPIVNLFVFMFVFRLLLKARWEMAGEDTGEKETALIMLAGILVWAAFAETLTRSTNCLVENANLIQKVVFPSEILPVNLALSSVVNMLIGVPIVVVGAIVVGSSPMGPQMLLVPVLLLLQLVFTVGLGYLLATLNVLWRDTYHLVGVFVMVWMFSTPIFYPAALVARAEIPKGPTMDDGVYRLGWMLDINPMHWLIESWRDILLFAQWPDWELVLRFAAVAAIVFAAGSTFFMRQKRSFPDLL